MKGSENPYPSILLEDHVDPAAPADGFHRLFIDTDEKLKMIDHASLVTDFTPGAAGSVATDAIWDAKGDLAVGTGADTAQKLTAGTNDYALVAASGETTGLKWAPVLGAWTDYTPTWTATSTNPTLGNGTIHGRYKLLDAHTLAFQVSVTFGSTTNKGLGGYALTLPAGVTSAAYVQFAPGYCLNASVTNYPAIAQIAASDTKIGAWFYPGGNTITDGLPFTFADGDGFGASGMIEIA